MHNPTAQAPAQSAHSRPPDGQLLAVGLVRDARHRYSWNGGPLMPSVTTVIGVKDKPALVGWAKRETATCAVRNLDVLERMVQTGGHQAAADWLRTAADHRRDGAANLGTRVHARIESLARGQAVAAEEDVRPYLAAFRRDFLDVFRPEFIEVEAMVCSLRHAYGGTLDALVRIGGRVWLLDWKTGSGVYPEAALQLAGLARAEFIGRPGYPKPCPLPRATRFGVVHVRPDGARLVPVEVNRGTFSAFIAARRLLAWDRGAAASALGEPLAGPSQPAAARRAA